MFVPLPRRRSAPGAGALDDDAIEHLLAEVFGSIEDPEPINANLTEAEAQAILDGYTLAIERYRHRSQQRGC